MSKKIWAFLIIGVLLFVVFDKQEPAVKTKTDMETVPCVEEEKPSTEGNALSEASTDLSVVLKRRTQKTSIKIGALFPLSGKTADEGNGFKNALFLARDDLKYNSAAKYNYRFVIDDDNDAVAAYEKQKNDDNINAVVSFGNTGKIIAPLAEKDKIIHINFGAEDKSIAQGKYNFISWTMPDGQVDRLIDFYEEKGWKNIVFIGTDTSLETTIQNSAEKHGIKITSFDLQADEKDFLPALQKSKDVKADAYLVQIKSADAENFIKQYKNAGISAPLTNIGTFAEIRDTALLEGICYTDIAQSMDIFNDRVKQVYPETKSDFALGSVYDMVMLLTQTFENSEKPEKAVDNLAETPEYDGVIGVAKQDKEGIFAARAVLKCIIEGRPEVMYDPHVGHSH